MEPLTEAEAARLVRQALRNEAARLSGKLGLLLDQFINQAPDESMARIRRLIK